MALGTGRSRDSALGAPPYAKLAQSRKEEVQRLLAQALVLRIDNPNAPYLAPVVINAEDGGNVFSCIERHLKSEFHGGAERFWRLVRTDLNVETWRPRVQGLQYKALVGARLPETEGEMAHLGAVVHALAADASLKPESSADAMMQDLAGVIGSIQGWWENRNRRVDGELLVFGVGGW